MPWVRKRLSAAGREALEHACNYPTPARLYEPGSEWKCFWCKDHWLVVEGALGSSRWERRNDALEYAKSYVNHPVNRQKD